MKSSIKLWSDHHYILERWILIFFKTLGFTLTHLVAKTWMNVVTPDITNILVGLKLLMVLQIINNLKTWFVY